jgi:uncharacterized membrane protein YdbT with pleckstrin-like domain
MGYVDKNLLPGESVVYRAKLHWSFYLTPICWILLSLLLGIWAFASQESLLVSFLCTPALMLFFGGLLMVGVSALAAGQTEFAVTDRRIIAKAGVIRRRSLEILLCKVESIAVLQPLLGMLLNYGTVIVSGTGGTREHFPNIADPQQLRRQVHARLEQPT